MYNVRLQISVCIARYIILYSVYICIKYTRSYTYNKFIVQYSYTSNVFLQTLFNVLFYYYIMQPYIAHIVCLYIIIDCRHSYIINYIVIYI